MRKELNNLTKANYLVKNVVKNKVVYKANTSHPLFSEVQNIVKKHLGFEKIVETVLEKMGDVNQIFLIGDYAKGIDSNMVEILIIGNKFNVEYIKGIEKIK